MAPSDGQITACPFQIAQAPSKTNPPMEALPTETTYASALIPKLVLPSAKDGYEVKARISTHNGVLVVIFKSKDYYGVMTQHCRLTLVGKFLKTRPKIEKIPSDFVEKVSIKGSVKIGA